MAICSFQRFAVGVICTCLVFGLLFNSRPSLEQLQAIAADHRPWTTASASTSTDTSPSIKGASVQERIHSLFNLIRHPYTDEYIDANGKTFGVELPLRWREPLKKKVLIVDIDTRQPNGTNEMLNPNGMNWEQLHMGGGQLVSGGMMGHYLYSQIHGYDYKFFQAQHLEGLYDTWIRPGAIRKLIENDDYQFVVTMDADVTISHPEVPLEWLFNHWGVTNNTSIAMPIDQKVVENDVLISVDSKGAQVYNAGFLVVQNLPHTKKMLEAWSECPNETRYPGCGEWKTRWSHEQRAFSEYIRYDFNPQGDNIVTIPCDDAMGYPGMMNEFGILRSDCNGYFFRHHTLNKNKAKESIQASIMQMITQLVHRSVMDNMDDLWYKEQA